MKPGVATGQCQNNTLWHSGMVGLSVMNPLFLSETCRRELKPGAMTLLISRIMYLKTYYIEVSIQ